LRTGKQQIPVQSPREFTDAESGRKLLCEKKGLWEGNCGTGKQQIPVQSPREFTDAESGRKLLCEKKGLWEGNCGTGIGG